MKKTIALLLLSSALAAQNYAPFTNVLNAPVFKNSSDTLRFVNIDSIISGPFRTIYYPHMEWAAHLDSSWWQSQCIFSSKAHNWIGRKVTDSLGTIYFDHEYFHLELKKQMPVGQSYIGGQMERQGNTYDLSIRLDSLGSINGDDLKHYSVQLIDSLGIFRYSNLLITLSKNSGLHAWPDLLDAGSTKNIKQSLYYPRNYIRDFQFTRLGPIDIFDWQVGDEFHYETQSSSPNGQVTVLVRHRVLGRHTRANGDTLQYDLELYQLQPSTLIDTLSLSFSTKEKYPYSFEGFSTPPQYHGVAAEELIQVSDLFLGRAGVRIQDTELSGTQNCYSPGISIDYKSVELAVGIGIVRQRLQQGTSPMQSNQTNLVYFKKGSTVWGSPIPIGLREELDPVSFFPNPAREVIYLEGQEQVKVQIYDRLGRLVLSEKIKYERLDISELPQGLYFLKTAQGQARFMKL